MGGGGKGGVERSGRCAMPSMEKQIYKAGVAGAALAALCIDEAAAVAVHLIIAPWAKVVSAGGKYIP